MTYKFDFGQPVWLLALLLLIPMVYVAFRSLNTLSALRRWSVILMRCVLVTILVFLLARLTRLEENKITTVIAVVDRSRSIPEALLEDRLNYLEESLKYKPDQEQFALVDVAETAIISKLPSTVGLVQHRSTSIRGDQSRLAQGIQMALAIAPADTASRILLISDGNQTEGDLKEAAEIAAMNRIPVDVLPIQYRYSNEVIFERLNVPVQARSNQTISLRFVLNSNADSSGRIYLYLNDRPVDLQPDSADVAMPIFLKGGTNVNTLLLPVGSQGIHEFKAVYIPDDPQEDQIEANNQVSAITYVAGPGRIMVVDADGQSANGIVDLLNGCELEIERISPADLGDEITPLIDKDAIVLVNTGCENFTYDQQEMLSRYVTELGGGLIMTGGPESFGAGGWIGSPIQAVLPVDLDPPQKKQLPKGALVLVIDSSGSMTGEKVEMCKVAAMASVRLLSRLDLVGVVVFDAESKWLVPLQAAEDKDAINDKIRMIGAGGGTIMGPAMEDAYEALVPAEAALKHMILLTDGMTSDRDFCVQMGQKLAGTDISVSTVAVGPEADGQLLFDISKGTEGRFYRVMKLTEIPKIFVKEAQIVRRTLIMEQPFVPQISYSVDEILKGLSNPLPPLDGFVLTGPRGGLSRTIVSTAQGDPVVASCQAGLGRSAVFTSSLDSRWGSAWLGWNNGRRFAEQLVRWTAKPEQGRDCEITIDVQSRNADIYIEAVDQEGQYIPLSDLKARVILPNIESTELSLAQTGPGQFKGRFKADAAGSHLLSLRYKKGTQGQKEYMMQTPFMIPYAPEFNDLTDNIGLLQQVSRISGGRVIESAPDQANLFDTSNVVFPRRQIPLTKPLMLLWLCIFLLDVAIRRVSIDGKAVMRKVRSWVAVSRKGQESQQTLTQLKVSRRKLARDLYRQDTESIRTTRYTSDKDASTEAPVSTVVSPPVVNQPQAETKQAVETPVRTEDTEKGHIQQLLRAKKKALDKNREH